MSMSQNVGYLLTGTKLCPCTGTNELDEEELRDMRARLRGRRQRKNKAGGGSGCGGAGGKRKADADGKMGDEGKRKR